jgi:hypothetical protein
VPYKSPDETQAFDVLIVSAPAGSPPIAHNLHHSRYSIAPASLYTEAVRISEANVHASSRPVKQLVVNKIPAPIADLHGPIPQESREPIVEAIAETAEQVPGKVRRRIGAAGALAGPRAP